MARPRGTFDARLGLFWTDSSGLVHVHVRPAYVGRHPAVLGRISQRVKNASPQVPAVYWRLSSKRILTMEFADGGQVNDKDYMQKHGIDVNQVAQPAGVWGRKWAGLSRLNTGRTGRTQLEHDGNSLAFCSRPSKGF